MKEFINIIRTNSGKIHVLSADNIHTLCNIRGLIGQRCQSDKSEVTCKRCLKKLEKQ